MAPVVSRGGGRGMGAKERKEAAQREKDAGDEAYDEELYKRAAAHYAAAADLDPGDISCLIKRATANFSMNKVSSLPIPHTIPRRKPLRFTSPRAAGAFQCKECVTDCDEALRRRRRRRRRRRDARCGCDEKLAADALFIKALALLNLAVCAADHEPAITALEGSLELRPGSKETRAKLDMAKRNRDAFAEQERLDQEAAKTHRDKGLELLRKKKYKEAEMQFTEAIKRNPRYPKLCLQLLLFNFGIHLFMTNMITQNFSDRARCLIELNSLPKALEDANRCIELDDTLGMGYLRKGLVQIAMAKYEDAIATLVDGLKHDPQNINIHNGLRECAARIKKAKDSDAIAKDLTKVKTLSSQVEQLRSANERNAS
uniref:Uncharacterized protein n=1 Tax=Oryza meridionalis TaxID=40149 RepID=A0A0E0DXA2_9ORYZ